LFSADSSAFVVVFQLRHDNALLILWWLVYALNLEPRPFPHMRCVIM